MFELVDLNLLNLVRNSAWECLAAAIAWVCSRQLRTRSPALTRAICILVVVTGLAFVRIPLSVPWLRDRAVAPQVVPQAGALPPVVGLGPPQADPINRQVERPQPIPDQPTPDQSTDKRWPWTWPGLIAGAWFAGMVLIPAVWTYRYARFIRQVPRSSVVDSEWQSDWEHVCRDESRPIPISLLVTAQLGPALVWRPVGYQLVVPTSSGQRLSRDQRRAFLRHELEHWRRSDLWKSLAMRLACLPHWFNPAGWWAARRFDEAAEWDCDRRAWHLGSALRAGPVGIM